MTLPMCVFFYTNDQHLYYDQYKRIEMEWNVMERKNLGKVVTDGCCSFSNSSRAWKPVGKPLPWRKSSHSPIFKSLILYMCDSSCTGHFWRKYNFFSFDIIIFNASFKYFKIRKAFVYVLRCSEKVSGSHT